MVNLNLLFKCYYSAKVWCPLVRGLLEYDFTLDWSTLISLLIAQNSNRTRVFSLRYNFKSTFYLIWRERNSGKHGELPSTSTTLVKLIEKNIRKKFSSLGNLCDNTLADGLALWIDTRPL